MSSVSIKADRIRVKGLAGYSLDEPAQGRVAFRLSTGATAWCGAASARVRGIPPSSSSYDHPGLFVGQPRTPPPVVCPAFP